MFTNVEHQLQILNRVDASILVKRGIPLEVMHVSSATHFTNTNCKSNEPKTIILQDSQLCRHYKRFLKNEKKGNDLGSISLKLLLSRTFLLSKNEKLIILPVNNVYLTKKYQNKITKTVKHAADKPADKPRERASQG